MGRAHKCPPNSKLSFIISDNSKKHLQHEMLIILVSFYYLHHFNALHCVYDEWVKLVQFHSNLKWNVLIVIIWNNNWKLEILLWTWAPLTEIDIDFQLLSSTPDWFYKKNQNIWKRHFFNSCYVRWIFHPWNWLNASAVAIFVGCAWDFRVKHSKAMFTLDRVRRVDKNSW